MSGRTLGKLPFGARSSPIGPAVAALVAVLLSATVYEALVAVGVIDLGSLPGEGPPGEGFVLSVALFAMIAGAALTLVRPSSLVAFVAPAAAAFLIARFYTFDPYYLPTLRRMSDDGLVSPVLVYLVAALAVGAAALAGKSSKAVAYLATPVIVGAALLAVVMAGGH